MRVLICDDNADAADVLAVFLRSYGHDVKVFYDGRSCVREGVDWKPTVAFLDIGMPQVTGYGVARELREKLGGNILLVAVTAYDRPEDRTQVREAGFDIHMRKPVDLERILATTIDAGHVLARNRHDEEGPQPG